MSKSIQLNVNKTHIFKVNDHMMCLHTSSKISAGQIVVLDDKEFKVKEVVKEQQSQYYKKNHYYEIKIV